MCRRKSSSSQRIRGSCTIMEHSRTSRELGVFHLYGHAVLGPNEVYFAGFLTKGCKDGGNRAKLSALTRAGEIGAGPFSVRAATPEGPNSSWRNLTALFLLGASFNNVMPHATCVAGIGTVRALRAVPSPGITTTAFSL